MQLWLLQVNAVGSIFPLTLSAREIFHINCAKAPIIYIVQAPNSTKETKVSNFKVLNIHCNSNDAFLHHQPALSYYYYWLILPSLSYQPIRTTYDMQHQLCRTNTHCAMQHQLCRTSTRCAMLCIYVQMFLHVISIVYIVKNRLIIITVYLISIILILCIFFIYGKK